MTVTVTSRAPVTVMTTHVIYKTKHAFNAKPDGLECIAILVSLFIIYDDMNFAKVV